MCDQSSNLRLFRYQEYYISTFEDSAHDPHFISTVSVSRDKDDNLFPSRLSPPLQRDPIQRHVEGPVRKAYGYPICWSEFNFEWYPYLPAVVNFNYPVFKLMSTDPLILHKSDGYGLTDREICQWRNVEYVMLASIQALQAGCNLSLEHQEPLPPSAYGYTRGHSSEKFAKRSAMKSLNAFQRLLAYCSYTLASHHWRGDRLANPSYNFGSTFSVVYRDLQGSAHILAKRLLQTLWEIHSSSNFTGIVVRWERYDFPAVAAMFLHHVPVYVTWTADKKNPYSHLFQFYYIKPWLPHEVMLDTLKQNPPHLPEQRSEIYNHPMDYVTQRLLKIPAQFDQSAKKRSMRNRLRSALSYKSIGRAKYFKFEQVTYTNEQGQPKEGWTRKQLTSHYAIEDFQNVANSELWYELFLSPSPPPEKLCRYDHVLNQWNSCKIFSFRDNEPVDPAFVRDEMNGMEAFGFFEGGPLPDLCLHLQNELEEGKNNLEEGEIVVLGDGVPNSFYNEVLLLSLQHSQHHPDLGLVSQWLDCEDFLLKRWGLCLAGMKDDVADSRSCIRLGLPKGPVDTAMVNLFEHLVEEQLLAPTTDWDLAPDYHLTVVDGFPHQTSHFLNIQSVDEGYLLAIVGRPWKLLIKDPLTLLQIEREEWHSKALVSSMIRKGLPFLLLYPACRIDIAFHPNPGPVIHPEGKYPTRDDYLAYRLDVARFFTHNPYAHAAALCAGGILWRIAMDVLPIPDEQHLAGPFHRDACHEISLLGQRYWSPVLSREDEETIVGVYKWPGKSNSKYQGGYHLTPDS